MAKIDRRLTRFKKGPAAFKTARAAWKSISEKTGVKASQVKADHTPGLWRWVKKKAKKKTVKKKATRKKATRKKATKKKAVKKKATRKKATRKKATKKKATRKKATRKKATKKKATRKKAPAGTLRVLKITVSPNQVITAPSGGVRATPRKKWAGVTSEKTGDLVAIPTSRMTGEVTIASGGTRKVQSVTALKGGKVSRQTGWRLARKGNEWALYRP